MKMRYWSLLILVTAILIWSQSGLSVATVIYQEAFNSGSSLEQLGFSGGAHTGWELDQKNRWMETTKIKNRFDASIYTPEFTASREQSSITCEWETSFQVHKEHPHWDRDNILKVSLSDRQGKPLYSLLFAPHLVKLPHHNDISPLMFYKKGKLVSELLKHTYLRKEVPSNTWIKFRMTLNPQLKSGGDAKIIIACDLGDGKGYQNYIEIKDESYLQFAKMQFEAENRSKNNNNIAVDNIRVLGTVQNKDATPPSTTHDFVYSDQWVNAPVTVHLTSSDTESGVAGTYYRLNKGETVSGNVINIPNDGIYTLEYWAVDQAGNTEVAKGLTVKLDQTAPLLSANLTPTPNALGWNNSDVQVDFSATDNLSGIVTLSPAFQFTTEGSGQAYNGQAIDGAGNGAAFSGTVNIDKTAPVISSLEPCTGTWLKSKRPEIAANFVENLSGVNSASIKVILDDQIITSGFNIAANRLSYIPATDLSEGKHVVKVSFADQAGNISNVATTSFTIDSGMPNLPPDPQTVASPLENTVVTDMASATKFLYTGENPIQTGMSPETIVPQRAAVIRGKVLDKDGQPIPGVKITVLNHPEYGQTLSRMDGYFDLAVNGGGYLTIKYQRAGYLDAQRQVDVPWQDYAWLAEVSLIKFDHQVTPILLSETNQVQVARGSISTDENGTRQATLFFPPGTKVTGFNGDTIHVRATEYTVGKNGPNSMPAVLPPTSGYTYCVELSTDEAEKVEFNQPIYCYLENFLDFPVGGIVPAGYYDKNKAEWIPSKNGRIIRILSIGNGKAEVDVTGDGRPADAQVLAGLGFTDAEREKLASLYTNGQSLWRVPVTHFTPWDYNWPYGPPLGAVAPSQKIITNNKTDDPTRCGGSIIEMQNQVLGEAISISGTPFALYYSSDRAPGFVSDNTLLISLTDETLPPGLKRIELEIEIEGRRFTYSVSPAVNQKITFTWDGKDAYGRLLLGKKDVGVRIGYVYDSVYYGTATEVEDSFGRYGSGTPISGSANGREVILWQNLKGKIGLIGSGMFGMGQWSLSIHHYYDPQERVLYLGSGQHWSAKGMNIIETVAGADNLNYTDYSGEGGLATDACLGNIEDIEVGPDGSLYIVNAYRILKVGNDGVIKTIAGTGVAGYNGDGIPAIEAQISMGGVSIASDGSIYFADADNCRIRKISVDGIITTVAGTGVPGYEGDGGPAATAKVAYPKGVACAPDGSVYFTDTVNHRIRCISTDGMISTIAGCSEPGDWYSSVSGDGGPALQAQLAYPSDLVISSDGSLYFNDVGLGSGSGNTNSYSIRRIGPDGMITRIAGNGEGQIGYSGDGGPATEASLYGSQGISVDDDGRLYTADNQNYVVRMIETDGTISTIAGFIPNLDRENLYMEGAPPRMAFISPRRTAVGPDGSIYIAEGYPYNNGQKIRRVNRPMKGFGFDELLIPSEDGSEVYQFNANGRHLSTINALNGAIKYTFNYNEVGLLIAVVDGDNNTTTIERDFNGNPAAIIGPYGQRNIIKVESNGYLESVTDAAGQKTTYSYQSGGLLHSMTDPNGNTHIYTYDTLGQLTRDEDPAGGYTSLTRTLTENGHQVRSIKGKDTSSGYVTDYLYEKLPTGDTRMVTKGCCGGPRETIIGADGTSKLINPDGTEITTIEGTDPRFGMQAPRVKSQIVILPSGQTIITTTERTLTLSDLKNPLSLQQITDTVTTNDKTYSTVYDAVARTIATTNPSGRQSLSYLDEKGRVIRVETPGLAPVCFEYDQRGRLVKTTEGTGSAARISEIYYNTQGYIDYMVDPLLRQTRFEYDAVGRVTKQVLPGGKQILYAYDANGNMTKLTPPEKPDHEFAYNSVDLAEGYTAPNAGESSSQTSYSYNLAKQAKLVTRPDGKTIGYEYNTSGRLLELQLPDGDVTYVYNANTGQLTNIIAPEGSAVTFGYDGALPLSTQWAGLVKGKVEVTYNDDLQVATQSVNGENEITYGYDDDGLLTAAGDLTLNRNAANGMVTGSKIGNISDSVAYNEFGEVSRYQAVNGGIKLFDVQYGTRDKLGRIVSKTETIGGETHDYRYVYDANTDELTDVYKDNVLVSHYDYDANGNRVRYIGKDATVTGSYDSQDRMLSYGGNTYHYTANGELASKTGSGVKTDYTYDVLGNLKAVVLPDGTKIEYLVDGANRRIGKKVNGNLVQGLIYQSDLCPVAELDSSNNVVSRFVYGTRANVPDYMLKDGVTYRIISDHLGSVRLVVNASTGDIVQKMEYDEFGRVLSDTNSGFQPFGFAGGLYDKDAGLVRFGARDYDAETGRWTAKDPIGFSGGDTELYGYCGNDPINFVDSKGLWTFGGGFTAGTAFMGRGDGTVMIVIDGKMNIGLYVSTAVGGGTPTLSGGFNFQGSTAVDIYKLRGGYGSEIQVGGSGPLIGIEGFASSDLSYTGLNVSGGIKLPEGHGTLTGFTTVNGVNLKDLWNWILERFKKKNEVCP